MLDQRLAPIYFNDIDPVACAVLRECHGGTVDGRSIKEVNPDDVRGYERAHWFAGAGLWQVAADMAGWRGSLWTASCPCQPFSGAGKRAGRSDPRHLWPDLFRIVRDIRPPVLVGEQVASPAGLDWFDGVAADLEGQGYACRAVDIPACAVDAPHQRQRLYWVAVADSAERARRECGDVLSAAREDRGCAAEGRKRNPADGSVGHEPMADADSCGRDGRPQDALGRSIERNAAQRSDVGLVDAPGPRRQGLAYAQRLESGSAWRPDAQRTDRRNSRSFWDDAEWIECADEKARRAKRGLRLLAHGVAGRTHMWRLAGNSIVAQVAAEVLSALAESLAGG